MAGNVQTGKHTYAMFTFIQLDTHTLSLVTFDLLERLSVWKGKTEINTKYKKTKFSLNFHQKSMWHLKNNSELMQQITLDTG